MLTFKSIYFAIHKGRETFHLEGLRCKREWWVTVVCVVKIQMTIHTTVIAASEGCVIKEKESAGEIGMLEVEWVE